MINTKGIEVGSKLKFVKEARFKGEEQCWWQNDGLRIGTVYEVDYVHHDEPFVIIKGTPNRFFHHIKHFDLVG